MYSLNLFCKTYSKDLKRAMRLLDSIQKYNVENIPLYVSVPESEYDFFKSFMHSYELTLLKDEEVVSANPKNNIDLYRKLPGGIQQQIVKAEFWRLSTCINYLCLDSDCKFIRDFRTEEFLWNDDTPYTVMDEGQEFLESVLKTSREHMIEEFHKGGVEYRDLFQRTGRVYSFGPMPVIWSRHVWESLDLGMLRPRGWSIVEAIQNYPSEIPWYGEALLEFKAIELRPCQPLFKVYHYARQYDHAQRLGIGEAEIRKIYMGVIYQSAWERNMDWPREGGNWSSRLARRLRRRLGRS